MNFTTEYRELAKRTLPDLGSLVLNSIHMSVGIASETYELIEASIKDDRVNIGEEIGDKLWYLANYMNVNNIELYLEFNKFAEDQHLFGEVTNGGEDLIILESMLLDYDKKFLAYGKERDRGMMTSVVDKLFTSYNNLILLHKLDPSSIMSKNIAKLYVRFPDKFTAEDANNRDLQAELEVLSK